VSKAKGKLIPVQESHALSVPWT